MAKSKIIEPKSDVTKFQFSDPILAGRVRRTFIRRGGEPAKLPALAQMARGLLTEYCGILEHNDPATAGHASAQTT